MSWRKRGRRRKDFATASLLFDVKDAPAFSSLTFLRYDPRPLEVDLVGHEDDCGLSVVGEADPPEIGQDLLGHVEAAAVDDGVDDHAAVGLVGGEGVFNLSKGGEI